MLNTSCCFRNFWLTLRASTIDVYPGLLSWFPVNLVCFRDFWLTFVAFHKLWFANAVCHSCWLTMSVFLIYCFVFIVHCSQFLLSWFLVCNLKYVHLLFNTVCSRFSGAHVFCLWLLINNVCCHDFWNDLCVHSLWLVIVASILSGLQFRLS